MHSQPTAVVTRGHLQLIHSQVNPVVPDFDAETDAFWAIVAGAHAEAFGQLSPNHPRITWYRDLVATAHVAAGLPPLRPVAIGATEGHER